MCLIFDAQKPTRNVHKSLPEQIASRPEGSKSRYVVAAALANLTRWRRTIGDLILELNVVVGKPVDELKGQD